jgi:hypothetical protein
VDFEALEMHEGESEEQQGITGVALFKFQGRS